MVNNLHEKLMNGGPKSFQRVKIYSEKFQIQKYGKKGPNMLQRVECLSVYSYIGLILCNSLSVKKKSVESD